MALQIHYAASAIALNRFGLGARPGDAIPADPKKWLLGQFDAYEVRPAAFDRLPDAGETWQAYEVARRERKAREKAEAAETAKTPQPAADTGGQNVTQKLYRAAIRTRADVALSSEAPFVERLTHFWANHFCVSADNQRVATFAGAFERDAIRPHVLGRFEDMLLAVEQHPAMLIYLNQVNSIGPNSPQALTEAKNAKNGVRGLNENLAREILELHTLGVRSGYTQTDVTEFARALTGWSVDYEAGSGKARAGGGFVFQAQRHEPGPRVILGKTYTQPGAEQARAALHDFTRSPATARHIATKLARHFAGDEPPQALIDRLATAFQTTDGDLKSVYRVLIASPEPWVAEPLKFKSPWDWTLSTLRALGKRETGQINIVETLTQLGQPVWKPGSPAGWEDLEKTWAAPDGLYRRVELAAGFVAPLADKFDARQLADSLLPASVSPATRQEVSRAETSADALALLLVSPDFLRR
ncbi:MAG: DUF1800 domain-containing protein [Asticcacaulis sp.]